MLRWFTAVPLIAHIDTDIDLPVLLSLLVQLFGFSGHINCPQSEKMLRLLPLWEGDGWVQLERMSQNWNRFSLGRVAPALFLYLFGATSLW